MIITRGYSSFLLVTRGYSKPNAKRIGNIDQIMEFDSFIAVTVEYKSLIRN